MASEITGLLLNAATQRRAFVTTYAGLLLGERGKDLPVLERGATYARMSSAMDDVSLSLANLGARILQEGGPVPAGLGYQLLSRSHVLGRNSGAIEAVAGLAQAGVNASINGAVGGYVQQTDDIARVLGVEADLFDDVATALGTTVDDLIRVAAAT